jgi:hypothetical protein
VVIDRARRTLGAAMLAGLISVTACSSQLGEGGGGGGGGGQSSMPSSIVVNFKTGVLPHQAIAEVKTCHPLAVMGSDTARSHGRSATSVTIWGPQSGTTRAAALFKCLKAAPGVAGQSWVG